VDNGSCSTCDAGGSYKYEYFNETLNETDCLSQCPINGYYENSVTVDNTINDNTTNNNNTTTNNTNTTITNTSSTNTTTTIY